MTQAAPIKKPRAPRSFQGLAKGARIDSLSPEVRRIAACVLEVLAGVRTPEQAAAALNLSLATYYNTETRALRGLMAGCSVDPPGRPAGSTSALRTAQSRVTVLERQLQRYQALLRASQRSVGLAAPPPPLAKKAGSRRKKPSVRALRAIKALRDGESADVADPAASVPETVTGASVDAAVGG